MDRKRKFRMQSGILTAFFLLTVSLFCGCTAKKLDTEVLGTLEFTVTAKEEIPEELRNRIEEEREEPLKLTYGDGEYLYIARGYGAQETAGCSIEVKAVYETKNAVYIQTELKGPAKDEEILEKTTYPYVVVKIEYRDKQVVFE